ncbi:hypothetical protein AB7M38_000744 [Bradyrhizobium diazoefficiens]
MISTGAVSVLPPAKTYWPSYCVFSSDPICSRYCCAVAIAEFASVELPVEAALSCERNCVTMSVIDPTAEYITCTRLSASVAAST